MTLTLKQYIEELQDLAKEIGGDMEVVSVGADGESFTPVIAFGPDKDGVKRVFV